VPLAISRIAGIVAVFCLASLNAQQPDKSAGGVPRLLVPLNGSFHPANGLPVGPIEGATLSIYKEEQGGVPLWEETQNVTLNSNGQYTAMLGITQNDGVPPGLFSATESRWLGVQFNRSGEVEQPRVQLVSVPYALKAVDAETLGDKPASAYLLAPTDGSMDTRGDDGTTTPGSTWDVAGDINSGGSIRYQGNPFFPVPPASAPGNGALQNGLLKQSPKSTPMSSPIPLMRRLKR
jgi:hypothetical protein